jgi:glycosyltransferase involved in cell wall biosynthesis
VHEIVIAGAHFGHDTRKVPLGGGAQVGNHLIRHWAREGRFHLTVLGSGPGADWEGVPNVRYHQVSWDVPGHKGALTDLSVRQYASFSRQFERGVTAFLTELASRRDPQGICVIHNDLSEAGDFGTIRRLGFCQVTIFHVDVVDYAVSTYLHRLISAPTLTRAFRGLAKSGLSKRLPNVVRLIFEKQEECARHCDLLVVPSPAMAEVLLQAYPWLSRKNILVTPWGGIGEKPSGDAVAEEAERLRERYVLDGRRPVLLSLSRISPEKGQDLLLSALRLWERREEIDPTVLICGAPAYIHGKGYMRRLNRLAGRLRRVPVHFPGYVTGVQKAAFFAVADLYVFPSRHESYGLTLVEALQSGLPVLTTDHRSAQDLVRDDFGRVVEATPEGLYQGLRELLSRGEELSAMGERAQRFAEGLRFETAAGQLGRAIEELF